MLLSEKRKFPRKKYLAPVELRRKKDTFKCVAMNLSREGMGLLCDHYIELGECKISIKNARLEGTIVFRQKHDHGLAKTDGAVFQYGIRLTKRMESNALDDLIRIATLGK